MDRLNFCPLSGRTKTVIEAKKRHVQSYLKTLSLLKRFLGNASVYAPIGFDFFPALDRKVFGFNNRSIKDYNFFETEIRKWLGSDVFKVTARLNQNLKYIPIPDTRDVNNLKEKLASNGFFSISGTKSLILKGTMIDLFKKEFDPDTERYYPCPNSLSEGRFWLEKMLGLFKKGDYIVAFDSDINFFPNPHCKEVTVKTPMDLLPKHNDEILIGAPDTIKTRLYLPVKFKVFKIIV